jgi:hypothetical protein
MFKIMQDSQLVGYSDTLVHIKLHENGCYVPCAPEEATGVCAKIPAEYTDEDGGKHLGLQDAVFKLAETGLSGIEPRGEVRDEPGALRMAAADQAAGIIDDATASRCVMLYSELRGDGGLIKVGTRVRFGDGLKRATVDLWDTPQYAPDVAPNLWEDVAYVQGYRVIPEVIYTPSAFHAGEIGYWQGAFYRAKIDAVWNPSAHPPAWELVRV